MAGPDNGNGELTPNVVVPRKSAPIRALRRKKRAPASTSAASAPKVDEPQTDSIPPSADTPDRPASASTSTEAAPQRSGAALSYRERRRAGAASVSAGSDDSTSRVVPTKADRSGLGVALAGVLAGVVVIALVVMSVLFAMGTDKIDDRNAQRAEYSAFARQMIVNLTSLSPTTIDQVTQTFETKTSGKALEQLQQSLQQTTDLIKSQGVTTKGTILSDAVVSSDADSATVMLVSGWTMDTPAPPPAAGSTTPPVSNDPVVQTFRWKVTVTTINGVMKMTDVEWVT